MKDKGSSETRTAQNGKQPTNQIQSRRTYRLSTKQCNCCSTVFTTFRCHCPLPEMTCTATRIEQHCWKAEERKGEILYYRGTQQHCICICMNCGRSANERELYWLCAWVLVRRRISRLVVGFGLRLRLQRPRLALPRAEDQVEHRSKHVDGERDEKDVAPRSRCLLHVSHRPRCQLTQKKHQTLKLWVTKTTNYTQFLFTRDL